MLGVWLCSALTMMVESDRECVGWMSGNEARVFEDKNPKAGLKEVLVQVNASRPDKTPI